MTREDKDKMIIDSPDFARIVESVVFLRPKELTLFLRSQWYCSNKVSMIRILGKYLKHFSSSLSISTIAHCWDRVLSYADTNKVQSEFAGKIRPLLIETNKILKENFNDFNDSICFRLSDETVNALSSSASSSDRQLDQELCMAIDKGNTDGVRRFLGYGANPWFVLSNGKSLLQAIMDLRESLFQEIIESHDRAKDLKHYLSILREFALCDETMEDITVVYPKLESRLCLPTRPRIIYTVQYYDSFFDGHYCVDMSYDAQTDEYIIKDESQQKRYMGKTTRIKISREALAKVLSGGFIEDFLRYEKPTFDKRVLDGTSYTLCVISKDGAYRKMEFNDYEGQKVPYIKYLIDNLDLQRDGKNDERKLYS